MNYSSLSTMIQDACENTETSFVTHIPDFIHAAEQRIFQAIKLPVSRTHTTLSTVAGNRIVTAPSDYLASFAASAVVSNKRYDLEYRDVDWLSAAFPEPAVMGIPAYYGLYTYDSFMLSKTPQAIYTIHLHYFYRPTSIVSGSTSWLGDNFDNVLFWGSMVQAYLYLKGEDDLVKLYDAQFKEGLASLGSIGDNASKERKV